MNKTLLSGDRNGEAIMKVYARHLAGRCRTGSDSKGALAHAVPVGEYTALCGRTYGRRSAGWSDYYDRALTCPRCLRKMQQIGDVEVIEPEAVS
jgi:hypothetical protein